MEAPFDATSWDGITGAFYTGYGSVEPMWILVMILCVIIAVIGGWRHEKHAYDAARSPRR